MRRIDHVYLIATIGKKRNSYRLLMRVPKTLAANEVCYNFQVDVETDDWFKRIQEISLGVVKPPNFPGMTLTKITIEKDTPFKVIDRLTGRE